MLVRTKGRIANISIEFHLPGGSRSLQIEEDTARLLFAVIAKMRSSSASEKSDPVDAMHFAKVVEKRAGGSMALVLRSYRNRLGLSQSEVAKATGIQASHLSSMERGKRKVTAKMAKRLAEVLKCDWRKLAF